VRFCLDLDGTLLDCRPRQLAVTREVLLRRGLALSAEMLAALWQHKREGLDTSAALRRCGVAAAAAALSLADFRREVEDDRHLLLDAPLPGVDEALAALRERGCALHVLTARARPDAVRAQVRRLFGDRVGEPHVVPPDAAVAGKTEVLRALAPAAFVGDTETDAAAAAASGTPFHAVASGQRSRAFLAARGLRVYDDLAAVVRSTQP
jgi:phosphoglycolate phosphatase-like HAD superfamily hydrolase